MSSIPSRHDHNCSKKAKAEPGRLVSTKSWTIDCAFAECGVVLPYHSKCLEGLLWFARCALNPTKSYKDSKGIVRTLPESTVVKGIAVELLLHLFKMLMLADCVKGRESVTEVFAHINSELDHAESTGSYLPPQFITSCVETNEDRSLISLTMTYYADRVSFRNELYCYDLVEVEERIEAYEYEQDLMDEVFAILRDQTCE